MKLFKKSNLKAIRLPLEQDVVRQTYVVGRREIMAEQSAWADVVKQEVHHLLEVARSKPQPWTRSPHRQLMEDKWKSYLENWFALAKLRVEGESDDGCLWQLQPSSVIFRHKHWRH